MKIARVDDIFEGYCKICDTNVTGRIITGSDNVFVNSKRVARIDDIVQATCGHIGRIITGSNSVKVNGRYIAIKGSQVDGDIAGYIVTGSDNVFTNR